VGDEDVLDAPDEELVDACARHVAAVLDLPAQPQASSVARWIRAMPQYEVGHEERVRAIRRDLADGVFVVGSAYDGVGIPDCVRAAGETADRVLAHLDHTTIEKETAR
jgi:oxygen-dependent protoporphyrinogen oxidase